MIKQVKNGTIKMLEDVRDVIVLQHDVGVTIYMAGNESLFNRITGISNRILSWPSVIQALARKEKKRVAVS